jgi:hypothetical protein
MDIQKAENQETSKLLVVDGDGDRTPLQILDQMVGNYKGSRLSENLEWRSTSVT